MEALSLLEGVREVSLLADAVEPTTVTQRAFDAARDRSPHHAHVPAARRAAESLGLSWRTVLELAHAPASERSRRLGRKGVRELSTTWLTVDYAAFALRLVAKRLGVTSLGEAAYAKERDAMVRANARAWLHGGQLVLPTRTQVVVVAGSWSAAVRAAGLEPGKRSRLGLKRPVLSRVDVMERFYEAYEEKPSKDLLYSFARGNGLPMSDEAHRKWSEAVAEWERSRRDRGLPPPRVVERRERGLRHRDYSRDVGAARHGEELYHGLWSNEDAVIAGVTRYLAQLPPRQRATLRDYQQWTLTQPDAASPGRFARHGGWGTVLTKAQAASRAPQQSAPATPQQDVAAEPRQA